ncbi:c-type cytochrome [Tropicibacter sp. S64]|uniref:c-type cytochrome n=1 Tax=Tropicibacter sp. S64 TaxID=3415122 RepID=UPI003C7DECAB
MRLLLAFLLLWPALALAQADAHDVYESACARCHTAHAGAFVFEAMKAQDGVLTGLRSGKPVGAFLAQGHGRVSAEEATLLTEHFKVVLAGGRVFQEKCAICHGRARELVRLKLIVKDGVLVGRYSGVEVEPFLSGHGRLRPEEVPVVLERLRRFLE